MKERKDLVMMAWQEDEDDYEEAVEIDEGIKMRGLTVIVGKD